MQWFHQHFGEENNEEGTAVGRARWVTSLTVAAAFDGVATLQKTV